MSATREKWIHHRKEQTRSLIPTFIGNMSNSWQNCKAQLETLIPNVQYYENWTVIDGDQGELSKDRKKYYDEQEVLKGMLTVRGDGNNQQGIQDYFTGTTKGDRDTVIIGVAMSWL
ncbi:hypothetical protein Tco_1331622 [Tanacetum coccineum]